MEGEATVFYRMEECLTHVPIPLRRRHGLRWKKKEEEKGTSLVKRVTGCVTICFTSRSIRKGAARILDNLKRVSKCTQQKKTALLPHRLIT